MLVTPLYAGILTLLFVLLSVRVMNLRRHGIGSTLHLDPRSGEARLELRPRQGAK